MVRGARDKGDQGVLGDLGRFVGEGTIESQRSQGKKGKKKDFKIVNGVFENCQENMKQTAMFLMQV